MISADERPQTLLRASIPQAAGSRLKQNRPHRKKHPRRGCPARQTIMGHDASSETGRAIRVDALQDDPPGRPRASDFRALTWLEWVVS
jgi:hypothetical protein